MVRNEHFGVTSLTVKIAAIYNLTLVSHCSFINFLFLKTLIIIKLIVIGNAHPHIHICTRIYVCILIRWRGNVEFSQMPESPYFNWKNYSRQNSFVRVVVGIVASPFLTDNFWGIQSFSCLSCLESLFSTSLKLKESLILLQTFSTEVLEKLRLVYFIIIQNSCKS